MLALVKNGDGGEIAYYLKRPRGPWKRVAGFADGIEEMHFGPDGHLYARSVKDAPLGRVLAIPLADARLSRARVVVPQAALSVDGLTVARSRLYLQYRDGGPSLVKMFDLRGAELGLLPAEALADTSVGPLLDGDDVLVRVMSLVTPATRYRYDAAADRLARTALDGVFAAAANP